MSPPARSILFSLSLLRRGPTLACSTVFLALLACSSAYGDSRPLCNEVDYKVATSSFIAVKCGEKDVSGLTGTGQLYDSPRAIDAPAAADIEVSPYPGAREWLILKLEPLANSAPPAALQAGKKYQVVLVLHRFGEAVAAETAPTAFDLDMSNTAKCPNCVINSTGEYDFVSQLAYEAGPQGTCTLEVQNFNGQTRSLKAHDCTLPAPIPDPTKISSPADLVRAVTSPEDLGSFQLTLDSTGNGTQQVPASVPDLVDIFDKPVKIDTKSQLMPEKAPASKDSSNYYVNFNYAAGKGSKPGWILDGKIAPVVGQLFHGYQFSPAVVADVGLNQVGSLEYTDAIAFGVAFTHMYEPNNFLQGLLFKPAVTYETDREFDRHNLLATPSLLFRFVGLYNPQERRNAIKYSRELKVADAQKIPWTRANSKPVLFGYVLDFGLGFEAGGALTDTTVKTSAGTARLPLPAYNIARVVPQAHALFEIGRFSVDAVGTARYLTIVENTVLERPDHTLYFKHLHGWNAFGVVTGSWNFDPAGHFAFTLSYKDGFSPPRFNRVNTVQSGITLKY